LFRLIETQKPTFPITIIFPVTWTIPLALQFHGSLSDCLYLFEHFVGRLLDIIGYYSQLPAGNVTNAAGVLLADNGKTAIEVLEECAQRLRIVRQIGEAHQYFYAPTDDMYFAMHAVFYEGRFLGPTTGQAEHRLVWVSLDDDAGFFHASHVWAAQRLRTYRK
jgi:hypothetical protein